MKFRNNKVETGIDLLKTVENIPLLSEETSCKRFKKGSRIKIIWNKRKYKNRSLLSSKKD